MTSDYFQPRYVAYARAHGRQPDEQLAADRAEGHMLGYIFWIDEQWRAFWRQYPNPVPPVYMRGDNQHQREFDSWLAAQQQTKVKPKKRKPLPKR